MSYRAPPGGATRSTLPAQRQAAGAPSAWSQPFQSIHERPRRWCDAGPPGRQSGPAAQKAGVEVADGRGRAHRAQTRIRIRIRKRKDRRRFGCCTTPRSDLRCNEPTAPAGNEDDDDHSICANPSDDACGHGRDDSFPPEHGYRRGGRPGRRGSDGVDHRRQPRARARVRAPIQRGRVEGHRYRSHAGEGHRAQRTRGAGDAARRGRCRQRCEPRYRAQGPAHRSADQQRRHGEPRWHVLRNPELRRRRTGPDGQHHRTHAGDSGAAAQSPTRVDQADRQHLERARQHRGEHRRRVLRLPREQGRAQHVQSIARRQPRRRGLHLCGHESGLGPHRHGRTRGEPEPGGVHHRDKDGHRRAHHRGHRDIPELGRHHQAVVDGA